MARARAMRCRCVDVQSTFSEAFTEGGMSMDVDVQSAFLRFLRLLLKR